MKSHCTFFRNTSEPGAASGGACTVRAQVAPTAAIAHAGGRRNGWPHRPRTAPPPLARPGTALPARGHHASPHAFDRFCSCSWVFCLLLQGLPGWSTEARSHQALPQAILPLPIVWEPHLHCVGPEGKIQAALRRCAAPRSWGGVG